MQLKETPNMSILKYTLKYLLICLPVLLVIFGIGRWMYSLQDNQALQAEKPLQKSDRPARKTPSRTVFGRHGHEDERHDAPPRYTAKIKRVRFQTNTRQNLALKNISPMLPITCEILPHPLPLPTDIQARLSQIYREMIAAGTRYERQDGENVITAEAYRREYDVLVGEMLPGDAVAFLETHGIYNPIILDKLEPRRAIDYLYKVRARQEYREAYARSVLAKDSSNTDAHLVLLSTEPDDAIAAAGYREIVNRNPENLSALNALGHRLHYDHPEEAIHYLKQANSLDVTLGYLGLGLASERLGDLKTAWLYYRKQQTIQNSGLVEIRKRAIEMGKPLYDPISHTSAAVPELDEASIESEGEPHKAPQAPAAEDSTWLPELSPEARYSSEDQLTGVDGREAARAAFERRHATAQQEFEEFLKWAESIMNAENSMDFLSRELAAHLKGGKAMFAPERTIRAYEMIERYGFEEGIQQIREKDPELAKQMERLTEERHPHRRNNSPNRR